jgi:hypothetical protein
MRNANEVCKNCANWERGHFTIQSMMGECVALPPFAAESRTTYEGDYCGMWKPIKNEKPLVDRLVAALVELEVQIMKPSMDGKHQCTVRGHAKKLSLETWATLGIVQQIVDGKEDD